VIGDVVVGGNEIVNDSKVFTGIPPLEPPIAYITLQITLDVKPFLHIGNGVNVTQLLFKGKYASFVFNSPTIVEKIYLIFILFTKNKIK